MRKEPPSSDLPGVVRLRDQQGALTRHTILRAARALFAERGYANTPVRLLAEAAGVAPQTIYATYGSKAGVLAGLPDLVDEEAGVVDLFAARLGLTDPVALLALLARISRQIRERCGDVVKVLRSGAAVDGDIAATLAEAQRRQRLGVRAVLKRVPRRHLAGDLGHATDVATALMSDDVCDTLVAAARWSFDDYEAWLRDTLATLLLKPARRRPHTSP